jgi:hypothetical protein
MLLFCCLVAAAMGATVEQVEARLREIAPLRAQRIETGAPPVPEAEVRKAAQGSVVTGIVGRKAWAAAVLDVPIGRLWAGLNDETRHPGYTAVAYSELLTGKPCVSGRSVFQYLPIPMVSDRWWIGHLRSNSEIARASGNSVRELVWRSSVDPAEVTSESARKMMAEGAPIGSSRGGWLLVAIDQFSTYVEYYSNTDPGEGIPSSISTRLAARGVRETIDAMVRFAKEGKPVCPVF